MRETHCSLVDYLGKSTGGGAQQTVFSQILSFRLITRNFSRSVDSAHMVMTPIPSPRADASNIQPQAFSDGLALKRRRWRYPGIETCLLANDRGVGEGLKRLITSTVAARWPLNSKSIMSLHGERGLEAFGRAEKIWPISKDCTHAAS